MTANDVVERIKKNLGLPWNDKSYRDTFKAGSPDTEVKGIATTFMATLDQIQRSHAAGLNFIVTHEPTFWSDTDTTKGLEDDPIFKFKLDFCVKNHITVWRFHDHLHARKPDVMWIGLARALGWTGRDADPNRHVYTLPPTTLGALAADVKKHLNGRAIRIVGDPKAKVSTIALGVGYNIPRVSPNIDVVMGGENTEADSAFDNIEYVQDAATLGVPKGEIILGHQVSEEPGMEDCAAWLRTFIPEVPIQWIRANEPFWTPQ